MGSECNKVAKFLVRLRFDLIIIVQRETLIKGDYEVELLEVQLRILLGGLSCLAMDPTVLPIIKCFCGSLVASISGELHLPL